jgi:hypothetical protein
MRTPSFLHSVGTSKDIQADTLSDSQERFVERHQFAALLMSTDNKVGIVNVHVLLAR